MPHLIDRTEATVLAALIETLRTGSAIPMRRPSWTTPTYFSRPITTTSVLPIAPTAAWVTLLTWETPVQFFSVIQSYAVATFEDVDPTLQWRITVDGVVPQNFQSPAGVDTCKDPDEPWPLRRRPFPLVLNPSQKLNIDVYYNGTFPQIATVGLWGWSFPTIYDERSSVGQGITDA